MKNIKHYINTYRDAIRHLWNSTFSAFNNNLRHGMCLELFQEIDHLLFKALVCEPLGIKLATRHEPNQPVDGLKVKSSYRESFHVMINRDKPATGYWDYPVNLINTDDMDLIFISFFDWDPYDQMDCRYYRVRIADSKTNADLIGRDALVETFYGDVFLDEKLQQRDI